jgi:uncharacterized protein YbjT (DUF2867 family)
MIKYHYISNDIKEVTMILVTGATGNVGNELVRLLIKEGRRLRVLSRDPEQSTRFPKTVEFVCGDLKRTETLTKALNGIEKVYLLAHPIDLPDVTREFVKVARETGVKHIVLNSSGMPPKTKIGGWHIEAENELKTSGLLWTMLRPGNFASNTARWAGMIRSQGTVFSPGNGKTVPIDPRDISAVAAKVLLGSGHEGKIYILSGPEALTPGEQVALIGGAIGRTLRYVEVSVAIARGNMLKSGMSEVMADAILELIEADGPEATEITSTVQDITGKSARTFDEWLKDHSQIFV